MKKLLVPLFVLAIFLAVYNQQSGKPNIIITVIAVVLFMFGMMQLSSKTPSKNQDDDDTTI